MILKRLTRTVEARLPEIELPFTVDRWLVAAVLSLLLALLFGLTDLPGFVTAAALGFAASNEALIVLSALSALATAYVTRLVAGVRETKRETRAAATATAAMVAGTGTVVATGLIEPVVMIANMFGDVIISGAIMGFTAVTGLISAASSKTMGAGRKGTAAAGAVGAASGGLMAAAVLPLSSGGIAIALSAATNNPVPVAVFGAAIMLFVTDALSNIGEFAAQLALILQLLTVIALTAIVLHFVFGLQVPALEGMVSGGGISG